ncbi:TolB family protein, partial [candidate division KSB1 bacterium]
KKACLLFVIFLLIPLGCGDEGESEPEVKIGTMKQVTFSAGNYPDWSPDGTRIIYTAGNSVLTISADGGDSLLIAAIEGGKVFHPRFNPADASQICFVNQDAAAEEWAIYVQTIGSDPEKIFSQLKQISSVSFTRDGTEIAFTKDPGSTGGVWLIPTSGGEVTSWPRDGGWSIISDVECAVDADLISFIEIDDGQAQNLFTLPKSGGTATKVTSFGTGKDFTQAARTRDGSKYCIRWGQRIWYGTDFNLYMMNSNGEEIEQVTTMSRPFDPNFPAWSPDGTKLALSRQPSGDDPVSLFVIDLTK